MHESDHPGSERRAETPTYRRVAAALREGIDAGRFRPRMPLPSEVRLQQEYGVSRDTVRRAVSYLADAGLVKTVPGRGTYVRALAPTVVDMEPGLRVRTRPASEEECELLEAEPGSWVLVVEHRDGEVDVLPGDAEIRVRD